MTKILLTRHGHVEGIEPERFRGRAELALTERGKTEAKALARRIAVHWRPATVYTSPLQRCVVTGGIVADACGIAASAFDGLMHLDYGAWQMRTYEEIRAEAPEAFDRWHASPHLMRFPLGESLQDLWRAPPTCCGWCFERHADETVVLVAMTASIAPCCCNCSTSRCRPIGV